MLIANPVELSKLPTMAELPYEDEVPVASDIQRLITRLLVSILNLIWADRPDWFFGDDIAWYHTPGQPVVGPDGMLCLGRPKLRDNFPRFSYVSWEENFVTPILVIEIVSQTPGGEYKRKKNLYASLGVLYYVVYAPLRKKQRRLSIYKLQEGKYELLEANPVWMPEIGLGIGTSMGTHEGITLEWLYWYNQNGERYLTPEEVRQQEEKARLRAEEAQRQAELAQRRAELAQRQESEARQQAEARATLLAAKLQELGINLDEIIPH